MEKERIRMSDIAQELGLSTATVSNVIHGKTKKISDETVRRVQELIEKRGYMPNMAEILLAQNNSRIIGVVVNDHEKYEGHVLEDGFIAASVNALSRETDLAGYFMMVKVTAEWDEIARFAYMWNMEGLVLIGYCEQDCKKLRASMHIPFVVYDGYFEEAQGICNLTIDNYDGGCQVGRYLKRMGHQRILCIADNAICMDAERMKGCAAVLGESSVVLMQIPMQEKERRQLYVHFILSLEECVRLGISLVIFRQKKWMRAALMKFNAARLNIWRCSVKSNPKIRFSALFSLVLLT